MSDSIVYNRRRNWAEILLKCMAPFSLRNCLTEPRDLPPPLLPLFGNLETSARHSEFIRSIDTVVAVLRKLDVSFMTLWHDTRFFVILRAWWSFPGGLWNIWTFWEFIGFANELLDWVARLLTWQQCFVAVLPWKEKRSVT